MTAYLFLCFIALGAAGSAIESRMWRVFAIALIASLIESSGAHIIDRFERKIYGASIPDTAACTLEVVP